MNRKLAVIGLMLTLEIGMVTKAWGQTPNPPPLDDTEARWQRAHKSFRHGDYGAALVEYLEVYKHRPLPVVEFNIGRTLVSLDRPVEAVEWLTRCLSSPEDPADVWRKRAKELYEEQEARIGKIHVSTNVVDATIAVDGIEVGRAPQTIRVASGIHITSVVATGYAPMRKEVQVAGGVQEPVHFELVPLEIRPAWIRIWADVPDADIFVDNKPAGKTPLLGFIKVLPGEHKIEVRRPGYRPFTKTLTLVDGDVPTLEVRLKEDANWIAEHGGTLKLQLSEEHALVTLDRSLRGEYRAPIHLAPGLHRLRVDRAGFVSVEVDVYIKALQTQLIPIIFEPNPDTLVKNNDEYGSRAKWGKAVATMGTPILALSGTLLIGLAASYPTSCNSTTPDILFCNYFPLLTGVSAGFVGIGGGMLGVGVWLMRGKPDPPRYAAKPSGQPVSRAWILPTVKPLPNGIGVGLVGAF